METNHYVVHTDRARANKLRGGFATAYIVLILVMTGFYVVMVHWAVNLGVKPFFALPILLVAVVVALMLARHCYLWGAVVGATQPLVLTPEALVISAAPGHLRIPWAGVASVETRPFLIGVAFTIRLHEGVASDPATTVDLTPQAWKVVQRNGIKITLNPVEDVSAILVAVDRYRTPAAR